MRITIDDAKMDKIIKTLVPILARGGYGLQGVDVNNLAPEKRQELARLIVDDILGDYVHLMQSQMTASRLGDIMDPAQIEQMVSALRDAHVRDQLTDPRGLGKYVDRAAAPEFTPSRDDDEFDAK